MKKITFLLLATLLFISCGAANVEVTVENNSELDRENEMVEVLWSEVQRKLPNVSAENLIVLNSNAKQIPYQLITEGSGSIQKVIFLATVKAGAKEVYKISTGKPEVFAPMVYGRLVPERKDDFAWENNRVAFRVYGPALEATGEISNGMDFWAKRTDSLVIDKWYKNDLAGIASYHEDHGEGLDFYKVGRTLGLGMTAPFVNDSLRLGKNFISAKIIDQGPLRLTFKLDYAPYDAGSINIVETRTISLDAYGQLNKVVNVFNFSNPTEIAVATGIVLQHQSEEAAKEASGMEEGILAYELPADNVNGTIFTGVIHLPYFSTMKRSEGHLIGINRYTSGSEYVSYAGGGWSKSGFDNFSTWVDYLKKQKIAIINPLIVTVK